MGDQWTRPVTEYRRARNGWHLFCETCFLHEQGLWKWWAPTVNELDHLADKHWAWHNTFDPGQTPPPGSGDEGAGGSPTPTPLADGSGDHRTADLPVNARPTYVYDDAQVVPSDYYARVVPLQKGKYLWQCLDCADTGRPLGGSHLAYADYLIHREGKHGHVELVEVDTDD